MKFRTRKWVNSTVQLFAIFLLFSDFIFPVTGNSLEMNISRAPKVVISDLKKRFGNWFFPPFLPEIIYYVKKGTSQDANPAMISGDFDGNRIPDFALLISHGNPIYENHSGTLFKYSFVIYLMKQKGKFKFYELSNGKYRIMEDFLVLMKKGQKDFDLIEKKEFKYPNDSIGFQYWEKAGGAYIFENGKFKEICNSD